MAEDGLVHWHEGLFLEPHHMQMMQRRTAEQFCFERRLQRSHPYGLLHCEVSQDELENMRVRLQRLQAVMPSGVVVDVPGNADLPSLDIGEAFKAGGAAINVYLAVPLWFPTRANSAEASIPDP